MEKPAITEGEWEVRNTSFGDMVCLKNRDIAIADCSIVSIGEEEMRANEKAIASVPDMIDALITVLEQEGKSLTLFSEEKIHSALKKAGCKSEHSN